MTIPPEPRMSESRATKGDIGALGLHGLSSAVYNPRTFMRKSNVHLVIVALFASLWGCGSGETLRVTGLQLGRSINADGTVAVHTTRFAPDDTVYLAVMTAGVGKGTIRVRWTFAGRVMGEPEKPVSLVNVAATEFRLQNAGGFPVGDYSVEAFLDGQSVGTREFKVEAKP